MLTIFIPYVKVSDNWFREQKEIQQQTNNHHVQSIESRLSSFEARVTKLEQK